MENNTSCPSTSKISRGNNPVRRHNLSFKPRLIKWNKEDHYILVRGKLQDEEVTLINMYAPNKGAASYIGQTLAGMKNLISNTTILMEDLNTPLSKKDRSRRWKISKEVAELNHNLEQLELVDIYRVFHPGTLNTHIFQLHMGHFPK